MRRRRVHFAAPFVLVTTTSCGQPAPVQAPPPSRPIEGMDYARNAEWARLDGGVDAALPVDAAVVLQADTSTPLVVTIVIPAYTEQPTGYVSCHNFGPHNRGCNPPRPRHHPEERHMRQMRALEQRGAELLVTIETRDGDPIQRGLPVSAQTSAMPGRARVGYVREVGLSTAQLLVTLTEAQVRDDAQLVIHTSSLKDPTPESARQLVPIIGEIINIDRVDDASIIVVNRGKSDGVDRGWRLEVVDWNDRPVKNGASVVVVVNNRSAVAKVKLTPDQLKQSVRVRLSPPD